MSLIKTKSRALRNDVSIGAQLRVMMLSDFPSPGAVGVTQEGEEGETSAPQVSRSSRDLGAMYDYSAMPSLLFCAPCPQPRHNPRASRL